MQRIVRKLPPRHVPVARKKRVAAYARVSTGKMAALESLATQTGHYSSLIQKHGDWEYAGVFYDDGVTGTKANRPGFQRMLRACRDGNVDMIIVKSISRFARNTVTLLETTRELKQLGVDVFFEEQNLHTLSSEGEMLLTMLAACAQEESRIVSENCRWRIQRDFQHGIPCSTPVYGYRIRRGELLIVPKEAAVVRMIFAMYLAGKGKDAIARSLNAQGIPAQKAALWSDSTIEGILRNEKYRGDLLLQKTFRTDYLSKKWRRNRGELEQVLVDHNHEPIISRGTFDAVQRIMRERATHFPSNAAATRHPFSGKLVCGICEKHYKRRKNSGIAVWQCSTYLERGKAHCPARQIRESILEDAAAETLGLRKFDPSLFDEKVKEIRVHEGNRLEFVFHDGTTADIEWQAPSRRESWDEAGRQRAREYANKRWSK